MTNLSKELCELCGIEGKWFEYTTETTDGCVNLGKKRVFPDFTQPENFVKLFKLITTLEYYSYDVGNYYIPYIPTFKQISCLRTEEAEYTSENIDPIEAFLTCVIKCAIKEKDTADYIRETEWVYD